MEDLYPARASFHPAGVGMSGNRPGGLQHLSLQHSSYGYQPAGVGTPLNKPTRGNTSQRGQNQDELQRQWQLRLNCQEAAGRRIAGITTTITTTYEDGGM